MQHSFTEIGYMLVLCNTIREKRCRRNCSRDFISKCMSSNVNSVIYILFCCCFLFYFLFKFRLQYLRNISHNTIQHQVFSLLKSEAFQHLFIFLTLKRTMYCLIMRSRKKVNYNSVINCLLHCGQFACSALIMINISLNHFFLQHFSTCYYYI